MSYIEFNGTKSTEVAGVMITSLPPISLPPKKIETIAIEGRDGDISIDKGYNAYDKKVGIALAGNYDFDKIIGWLHGKGKLITSDEPDKFYNAEILSGYDLNKLLKFKTGEIAFHTQPFKYSIDEITPITVTIPAKPIKEVVLVNEGNTPSRPIIHIAGGSGKINLSANGAFVFYYEFPENETEVTIDGILEEAYNGNDLKNNNMYGNFLELEQNQNTIKLIGAPRATVDFTLQSRWL